MRASEATKSLGLRVNGVVALCSMLCALCSTCLWAQTPVTVFPAKPKQGDTLMILVSSDNMNLTVSCTFNGETVPAYPAAGGYRALIGIPSTLKPGNYLLDITIQKGSEGDGEQRHLSVYVGAGRFGIQRLRISPSKNRLRFDPRVEEERKLKRAVLSRQTPQQLWDGAFWLPLRGRITTGYGLRRIVNSDPNYGTHKGLDIAAPAGTPVPAANTGIVALARPLILEGNTVILDHGHGVMTIYYHLSKLLVREGDLVSKGQIVGLVGATGLATGPHLHWGVYVNGTAVNPWRWTDRRFVEGLAFAQVAERKELGGLACNRRKALKRQETTRCCFVANMPPVGRVRRLCRTVRNGRVAVPYPKGMIATEQHGVVSVLFSTFQRLKKRRRQTNERELAARLDS